MSRDPLWYKDAVFYELHVKAFQDSNADGIGDFRGLVDRLDYVQSLGVDVIWLLPYYPSPLRDDGYDIADYYGINPQYGTLDDFQRFLDEAHRRGLRVIADLVLNHTSDQHPWFQRARRAPKGSPERDFYVWSDSDELYKEARIIFTDTEPSNWTWDPVAGQYYWHRFFAHQPDLNWDNPAVKEAMFQVMEFWLERGLDGFRADAVPYLIEREGTICENLPETHDILKEFRTRLERNYPGRILLAEANQWPDDVRPYFGDGDEFQMAFHFPLMPRIFMAVRQGTRKPIVEIIERTPPIPDECQWCMFLRNHDELTLEMVTDEERDYMYRRVRRRPADAPQPGHPPPAGAADGQRPAQDRAAELHPLHHARVAHPLLRRRDGDGGQHLAGRPRRGAHPHAVVPRPERRLLARRGGPALRSRSSATPSTASRPSTWRRRSGRPSPCSTG